MVLSRQFGFSLVELSIVLVILGLLTGGILAGQSLIRAAELRAVSTEYGRYMTAVQSFRDKYFAIPGDMSNATSFWTSVAAPASCAATASSDQKTCDGNGDGKIAIPTSSNEHFRFWQHLANAGLIEGQYDGIQHGTGGTSGTRANSPASKISTGLWFTQWRGTTTAALDVFNGDYGNVFSLGGQTTNTTPYTPILKPEEMWNVDTKLDDGKPATGNVVLFGYATLTDCTNASGGTPYAVLTADYKLTNTALACSVIFRNVF